MARLASWLKECGQDFVAHGVSDKNIKGLFEDGHLRCGEEILRRSGRLEFESSSGSIHGREVIYLPTILNRNKLTNIALAAFDLSDEKIEELILTYFKRLNNLERYTIDEYDGYEDDNFVEPKLDSKEGKLQRQEHVANMAEDLLTGFFKNQKFQDVIDTLIYNKNDEIWEMDKKPKEFFYQRTICAIAVDEALPEEKRCHYQLGKIYKVYSELMNERKIDLSEQEIGTLLSLIRDYRLIKPQKINAEIRTYRNKIYTCYGSLTILRGKASEVVGSGEIITTSEYHLLYPFQNKGKFFNIDLLDPKVLLFAPKDLISDLADDSPIRNNIIFTENLPREIYREPKTTQILTEYVKSQI